MNASRSKLLRQSGSELPQSKVVLTSWIFVNEGRHLARREEKGSHAEIRGGLGIHDLPWNRLFADRLDVADGTVWLERCPG